MIDFAIWLLAVALTAATCANAAPPPTQPATPPTPTTTTTLQTPGYIIDCAELDDNGNFIQWTPCPFDQP